MRVIIAIITGLCTCGAVLAEESPMFDQYIAAAELFMGTPAGQDTERYLSEEPARIMDNLDGTWTPISTLAPYGGDYVPTSDTINQSCEKYKSGIEITTKPPFSMTASRSIRSEGEELMFETIYSARGGNLFSTYTDADNYLKFLGYDPAKTPPINMMRLLTERNIPVIIYRPSPDILVINYTHYGRPEIYGRCQ